MNAKNLHCLCLAGEEGVPPSAKHPRREPESAEEGSECAAIASVPPIVVSAPSADLQERQDEAADKQAKKDMKQARKDMAETEREIATLNQMIERASPRKGPHVPGVPISGNLGSIPASQVASSSARPAIVARELSSKTSSSEISDNIVTTLKRQVQEQEERLRKKVEVCSLAEQKISTLRET